MEPGKGSLVVVSGPSGVGKDTVVKALLKKDPRIIKKISYTTRFPRDGEVNGRDYYFVTPEEFSGLRARGRFMETAIYRGNWYGTSLEQVRNAIDRGRDMVLILDVQGAKQMKQLLPETVFIFLMPPSEEDLQKRLAKRGTEGEAEKLARIKDAEREEQESFWYDKVIVNDNLDKVVNEIEKIFRERRGPAREHS